MYTLTARFFDGLFSLFKKNNENLFEHVAFPRGVLPPHRVGFLCRFGLKTGKHVVVNFLSQVIFVFGYGNVC